MRRDSGILNPLFPSTPSLHSSDQASFSLCNHCAINVQGSHQGNNREVKSDPSKPPKGGPRRLIFHVVKFRTIRLYPGVTILLSASPRLSFRHACARIENTHRDTLNKHTHTQGTEREREGWIGAVNAYAVACIYPRYKATRERTHTYVPLLYHGVG